MKPVDFRDWAVLEVAYSSGLRIGEICHLDVLDIDFRERTVRVRQGKGRKDRVVPMGRPALKVLSDWLEKARPRMATNRAEQALFVTTRGGRLDKQSFMSRFRKIRRLFGLKRLRVHDFRHASALHMLRRGADLRYIQEFLGHADLNSTRIYTRLAPTDLKRAHLSSHPRERARERL
jgi:integrase/recombinase XerC